MIFLTNNVSHPPESPSINGEYNGKNSINLSPDFPGKLLILLNTSLSF